MRLRADLVGTIFAFGGRAVPCDRFGEDAGRPVAGRLRPPPLG